jgi:hypothetical protein
MIMRKYYGLGQAGRASGGGAASRTTSTGPAGGSAAQISLAQRAAAGLNVSTAVNRPGQTLATPPALPPPVGTVIPTSSLTYTCASGYVYNASGQCLPVAGATTQPGSPVLLPSNCTSSQTYIPPGATFTAGPNQGQVSPNGACQDNPNYVPWLLGGAAVVLVVALAGRR